MDIQQAAIILLVLRLVSVAFLIKVISIQIPLLRAENDSQVKVLRYVLLFFAIAVTLGNTIPIIVDVLTILSSSSILLTNTSESSNLIYSFSNAITSVVSAVFFWLIYKVTGEANVKLEKERDALQTDNDQLVKDAR